MSEFTEDLEIRRVVYDVRRKIAQEE